MAIAEAAVRALLVTAPEGRATEIIDLRAEAEGVPRAQLDGMKDEPALTDTVDHHQPLRASVAQLTLRRAKTGVAPTATAVAVLGLQGAVLSAVENETDDPRTLLDTGTPVREVSRARSEL